MGYFLFTQNGWGNNITTGVFVAIYPLSIFHLESLRTTGEVLWFKGGFYEQLSQPKKVFLAIAGLASMTVFWLLTFTSIVTFLISIF